MYQNEASTTAIRVVALTLPIAATAANLKRSSVDNKRFIQRYTRVFWSYQHSSFQHKTFGLPNILKP